MRRGSPRPVHSCVVLAGSIALGCYSGAERSDVGTGTGTGDGAADDGGTGGGGTGGTGGTGGSGDDTGDMPDPTGRIQFDPPPGTFTADFVLQLSTVPATAQIHVTVDGTRPTAASPVYTAPIPVDRSTRIRAAAMDAGVQLGPEGTATYVKIDPDTQDFSSNLPLVIWNTFEGPEPAQDSNEFVPATMTVLTPLGGRTQLADWEAELDARIGIHVRGSSSRQFPKKSYRVETWDTFDDDHDVSVLGMPHESDWVFYAPLNFDRAFVRNALIYELSNRVGRWAGHTRFVEAFLSTDGAPTVRAEDYLGVYVVIESIKRGTSRVPIASLPPGAVSEPAVSGGYILKVDRPGPMEMGFHAGGSQDWTNEGIQYVYPEERNIVPEQASWIAAYIDQFAAAIDAADYVNPQTLVPYDQYIDVDAWIDHHILNALAKNPDALRLSAFMFKDQSGPLQAGPLWDFDRTMGSYDGRDAEPQGWVGDDDSTELFEYGWWRRLFENPEFSRRYEERWVELIDGGTLGTAEVTALVDTLTGPLHEAADRQYARWPNFGPRQGGYQAEVDHLRTWLEQRIVWIRGQYP